MDVARARSPPASLGRRPIGPRSPGRAGTAPPRTIVPLDLSARLQEAAPVFASPEPILSSSPRAASPELPKSPSEEAATHQRPLSEHSARSEPGVGDTTASVRAQSPPPLSSEDAGLPSGLPYDADEPPSMPEETGPLEAPAAVTLPPPAPEPEHEPSPLPPRADGSRPPSAQVSTHSRSLSEKSVQASAPAPAPASAPTEPSSTPASTRASTPALARIAPKRPPLAPPPALNFEAEPIPWKGMPLEAAQWTLTSEQLQETVSRAIRHSASESFIRVVPTHTFDVELPQELERLESLRMTTQAQYRFSMHRRTMLLQSLAALSQSQYPDNGDGEALYNLTTQLAELTISCDRLMETLVRISDQRAQIQQVQNLHIASALSMALRKLNTSYAKRNAELQEVRAQNEALNAELEEAWSMAQDMAQEMDDLDNFDLAFSDEEDEDADALEAEIYNDMDRMSTVTSVRDAEVREITGKAVATKAMLTTLPSGERQGDRTSRVFAAKKRSSRTSKASLRIPKTPTGGERAERPDRSSIHSLRRRQSRSKSIRRRSERNEAVSPAGEDVPEVPIIRIPSPAPKKEGSFLELSETRPVSPAISAVSAPPPLPSPPTETVGHIISSPSEDAPPPAPSIPNPPPSPTFDHMNIPTISLQEEPKAPSSSWRARKLFSRRVQSMVPPRAIDDTATAPLKRSISEVKQFDGWPFLSQKTQRFSVPVLSVIQPLRSRSSTDSAPAATTSRPSSSSTR